MKIEVDRTACLRSTQCSYLHPELFDRDAEDFPVPKVQHPGEDLREAIADAIELCPASAIRLVHKPTGIMVVASTYREQPQNKRQAMSILQAKLEQMEEEKREAEIKKAAGGDLSRGWGTQIRSYVIYDNRVKDHRTNHESGNPQLVLDGDIAPFIDAELKRRRSEKES